MSRQCGSRLHPGCGVGRCSVPRGVRNRGAVSERVDPAAPARQLHPSELRPSRALPSSPPVVVSVQPLRETDLTHRRHDPPFDQAAADGAVRGHPSGLDGGEQHPVGGTGSPVGGREGDGPDDEAEDHGGDGSTRGGKAAVGAGGDGRRPFRQRAFEQPAWRPSNGSTPRPETSKARSPEPTGSPAPDRAERHPVGFAWHYNRRHRLRTMIPRFLHSAARTRPIPYHALIAG